jgi:hypothetical protein
MDHKPSIVELLWIHGIMFLVGYGVTASLLSFIAR